MPMLHAGVGRRAVDPPLGLKTAGFYSREGVVTDIDGELSATVCVLRCADRSLVIAAVDLCMAPQSLVRRWRSEVAAVAGTSPDHVLVNLSHTHSSGALASTQPEFASQRESLDGYESMLGERLRAATEAAVADLRPARLGAGSGTSRLGVQRREMGPDGYVFLGEVPEGPIDDQVAVIRIDDLAGRPIAILGSYGCHPVTVGPRATVASADFPGPARAMVESTMGGLCLFLQGGGGDVMPRWGMGHESDNRDGKERIGWMLGGEIVAVAAGIRTHVRRGERVSIPSLLGPGQTMRPLEPVTDPSCEIIDARDRAVELDLVQLPSREEAGTILAERRAELLSAERSGSERAIQIAAHFVAWAEALGHAVSAGRRSVTMEVQALRIDDIVITGIAAEAFSSTTRWIRERSPFRMTMALGYTNGILCYLPPADAYPPGGWDVHDRYRIPDLVFQSYLLPVALAPDSEARVREVLADLVEELHAAPAPP